MLENAGNSAISPYHIWIFSSCAASSADLSQPMRLRADNFNQVMANCKLSVTLEIENLIPQSDSVSFVTVEINSLDDFHPLTLAKNLSVLNPLYETCQAVSARLENKIDENRFNEILAAHRTHPLLQSLVNNILNADNVPDESSVQQPSQDDEAIDRLFGMLDLGEQLAENPQHDDSEAKLFSRSYHALLTTSLHDVQRVLFQQLNKIIHHEEFQKLEQTWRGLKRVVDALPEDNSVTLTLINQTKTGLALRLVDLLETTGEHELPILVLHDFVINCTPADLTLLDEIAICSEAYQIISVVNLSNHFMGQSASKPLLQSENELPRLFAQPQYVKWKTLRSKPHARWLTCCFNRFLMRPVYSRFNNDLAFNEWIAGDDVLLMGNAVWIVANCVIASIGKTAWPAELTPPSCIIANQATHVSDDSSQVRHDIPLEIMINDQAAENFSAAGIVSLQCKMDSDTIFIRHWPTVFKPLKYDNELLDMKQKVQTSLPYQLITARIVNAITAYLFDVRLSGNEQAVIQKLQHLLSTMIEDTGEDSTVTVKLVHGDHAANHKQLKVKVVLGSKVLNGADIELNIPIS